MDGFQKISMITKLCSSGTMKFCLIFQDLIVKRQQLEVVLDDIPLLIQEYKNNKLTGTTNPENPHITIQNAIPSIRLLNICELAIYCLPAVGDIFSQFAHLVTNEELPKKFASIYKNHKKRPKADKFNLSGILETDKIKSYDKILIIRNELAHFSSLFLADDGEGNPTLFIKNVQLSASEDYKEEKQSIKVEELVKNIRLAQVFFDEFATYLLDNYIIKIYEPDFEQLIVVLKYDSIGFPIYNGNTFEVEQIKIGEYFQRLGIIN